MSLVKFHRYDETLKNRMNNMIPAPIRRIQRQREREKKCGYSIIFSKAENFFSGGLEDKSVLVLSDVGSGVINKRGVGVDDTAVAELLESDDMSCLATPI